MIYFREGGWFYDYIYIMIRKIPTWNLILSYFGGWLILVSNPKFDWFSSGKSCSDLRIKANADEQVTIYNGDVSVKVSEEQLNNINNTIIDFDAL